MTAPQFSVIVVTYNRPLLLKRAVDSVVNQDYSRWEMIVVDDGSEPPARVSLDGESVRIIRQGNAGPGAARKLGVNHSRGDVVLFLDDDDHYLPTHLSTLAKAYQQKTAIYVVGMLVENATGHRGVASLATEESITLRKYWNNPISLHPFAFPRDIVLSLPPLVRRSPIEDFEWIVYVLARHEAHQLPDYTAVYVQHEANRTNRLVERKDLFAREKVVKELYRLRRVRQQVDRRAYRKLLTHQRLHWTRQCLRAGQWGQVRFGLLRALGGAGLASVPELGYTFYRMVRTCFR